jgi:hypothetical protein
VVPNGSVVINGRNGLQALGIVGWLKFSMNSCFCQEELYLGTQISHEEFIKKLPREKISSQHWRTSRGLGKTLELFAEDMQSLEEVWYIYLLFVQAGSGRFRSPKQFEWVLPRASGVLLYQCRKNVTTSRRSDEITKRSLMQAKDLLASKPHFLRRPLVSFMDAGKVGAP